MLWTSDNPVVTQWELCPLFTELREAKCKDLIKREKASDVLKKKKLKKPYRCHTVTYSASESKEIFFSLPILNAIIPIIFTSAMPWGPKWDQIPFVNTVGKFLSQRFYSLYRPHRQRMKMGTEALWYAQSYTIGRSRFANRFKVFAPVFATLTRLAQE